MCTIDTNIYIDCLNNNYGFTRSNNNIVNIFSFLSMESME